MSDFFYRTEDINPSEIINYLVETDEDRQIINQLKSRNPTIIIGSRGVGKSFLMRVAEQELLNTFETEKTVPVYITFVSSSLLRTNDPEQFRNWMMARICTAIIRTINKLGLVRADSEATNILAGKVTRQKPHTHHLEKIIAKYEASWKTPGIDVNFHSIPNVDSVKAALEDLAETLNITRFSLYMDEAAHIFLPTQQRQFFTLFRDLRSHCVTCNAAVYPGVTSYGSFFQPTHDATMLSINRNILSENYVNSMREIVEKQANSTQLNNISKNGQNFAILAYAACGNPRILLKTIAKSPKVNSQEVNSILREYYRTEIWSEHSTLAEKYLGHKDIIDWGRNFLEDVVLPDLKAKNDIYLSDNKDSTSFIWIHRDAPEIVQAALRVLCYTGILTEHSTGIKATRSEIGIRYLVNLGCLLSLEATPTISAFNIATSLTPRRMAEFGKNHGFFSKLTKKEINISRIDNEEFNVELLMQKPNSVLDITSWQKTKLNELNLMTVGDVFSATEDKLKEAHYIGDIRARRMRNAAVSAVLEYLSG